MASNNASYTFTTTSRLNNFDDEDHLLITEIDETRSRCIFGCCCRHPKFVMFIITLSLMLLGHGLAIHFLYFHQASGWQTCDQNTNNNCVSLKILSLNTWGMPAIFGSKYKTPRIEAISEIIAKEEYDIFLLQELWMEADHNVIASKVPKNYFITGFRQLSTELCDGHLSPGFCSGLAIVSKYEFENVEFHSFSDHGSVAKAMIDGEYFARKGIGQVRIKPSKDFIVDVFVTHTAADPDPKHGYNNSYYRIRQVKELMETYVSKSTADIVILGGDFNAEPEKKEGSCYQMVRKLMTNSIQEFFNKNGQWLDPIYATYGNIQNTFTSGIFKPVTYDYIFHRSNNPNYISHTSWFQLPFFKTQIIESFSDLKNFTAEIVNTVKTISLSDHEAIESIIDIWKMNV